MIPSCRLLKKRFFQHNPVKKQHGSAPSHQKSNAMLLSEKIPLGRNFYPAF
jgi:hypothetical protein